MFKYAGPSTPDVLTPFPGPQLKQLKQFTGRHDEELLWGTYRPGYYFGAVLALAAVEQPLTTLQAFL